MTSVYSSSSKLKHKLKEQLRLFAFDDSAELSSEILLRVNDEMSKREKLATLLEGELNFHGENSSYASHDLHSFAAKFPPQLPKAFIRGLTSPGDIVLDPMLGSGTTVVEAIIEGRVGIGLDIDPLAMFLSNVKTTLVDGARLREVGNQVIALANKYLSSNESILEDLFAQRFDETSRLFIDYWFMPSTQRELAALITAIEAVGDPIARRFLMLTFSSIIVTKSGGVSLARDLAHSRPHLDPTKVPKNAIDEFTKKIRKNLKSIGKLPHNLLGTLVINGDTRYLPVASNQVDLIVTSPPYANAIDYMRAHKFSLVWFGYSVKELSDLRSTYIGSERALKYYEPLPTITEETINQLSRLDRKKADVLRKYFIEMRSVLREMYRVLRMNSAAIVVVGTSTMRGLDVQTHNCLAEIASELGFDVVGVVKRLLDRNKRMMPTRFGKKTDSMIEQRIHDEYVIGLLKP
jgi:DNA modification methylase